MAPSREEEEHFAKLEYEKRRALAEKVRGEMAAGERERLKALHSMRCPKCGQELITVTLRGVQVDKCAHCAGMWLDAGELEELVERDNGGAVKKLLDIFR